MRAEKQYLIAEVDTHLKKSDYVILANFTKVTVADTADLRKLLAKENAEFAAIAMLLQRWDDIAPWLIESLFDDEVVRRAFVAAAQSAGVIETALTLADPEARELLESAAVADLDVDPVREARNLIAAATRRSLTRRRGTTTDELLALSEARLSLDRIDDPVHGEAAAEALLLWLEGVPEEHGDGDE